MRLIRTGLGWILALGLAVALIHLTLHPVGAPPPGAVKFYDLPGEHLVFETLARKSGVATFEPAGRLLAGVLELIAAAALILPPFRRFGAGLVILLMGVGTLLHLSPWLGQSVPVSTDLLMPGNDGGAAFYTTLGLLAGGVMLMLTLEKREKTQGRRV